METPNLPAIRGLTACNARWFQSPTTVVRCQGSSASIWSRFGDGPASRDQPRPNRTPASPSSAMQCPATWRIANAPPRLPRRSMIRPVAPLNTISSNAAVMRGSVSWPMNVRTQRQTTAWSHAKATASGPACMASKCRPNSAARRCWTDSATWDKPIFPNTSAKSRKSGWVSRCFGYFHQIRDQRIRLVRCHQCWVE